MKVCAELADGFFFHRHGPNDENVHLHVLSSMEEVEQPS